LLGAVDVLLINPNRVQMPWPVVPVGLCLVATALERAGHRVELLDLTFARNLTVELRRRARRGTLPRVVAVGVRNIDNCNFERPVFFLEELRDAVIRPLRVLAPDSVLVIGGAGVNVHPEAVLEYLEADLAAVGEGETVMPALVAALGAGRDPRTVPGIVGRRDGGEAGDETAATPATVEPVRGWAEGFGLPSEAWRWVDYQRYAARGTPYPLQTKRGCALKCSYCVYNAIEGRQYRLRDPVRVVDEVAEAAARGVRHFAFVDSTFNLPRRHAVALCEEFARRRLPVELSATGLNPVGVTPDFVALMERAGFQSVMCTPESAAETTLASLQKGFGKEAIAEAARALRGSRMSSWWFFLLGAPGETLETVHETLAFCEEHIPPAHMVLFSTGIRVYPGTPLERYCRETGWFGQSDRLLEPSWYLSPELDLAAHYRMLADAEERHPNWMTNAETEVSPRFARAMKLGFRLLGWHGPFWVHLPKILAFSNRTGARRRGLELVAESIRLASTIRYRRALSPR
jgi:radical SAM superfamily enzyme YgiQ (UPF0313 family)